MESMRPLQAVEAFVGAAVGVAHRSVFVEFAEGHFAGTFHFVGPQLDFEAGEALQEPIGTDEGIDEESFEISRRGPIAVITGGHRLELGGILAGDDLSFGVDAALECIETGDGFALRSARACGELRIPSIRFDLVRCRHTELPIQD